MGKGNNRLTPKVKRRRAQKKLKNRIKRAIEAGKSGKKTGAVKPARSAETTTIRRGSNE